MHNKTIAFALSLLLVACATVPMGSPQKDLELKRFNAPQDKAGVYIYRPYFFCISGAPNDVLIDGEKIGQLGVDTYLYVELAPGRHVVTVQFAPYFSDLIGSSIPVDTVSGKLFFVSTIVSCKFLRMDMKLENDTDGKSGVMCCELAQPSVPSLPASPSISSQPPMSPPLPADEKAHFKKILDNGKPAQLYYLATVMTHEGHPDLAMELYQKLVDKYPDDIYTAKAIEKMDRGSQPSSGGNSNPAARGLAPQEVAHIKEAHDACVALCESQAKQCNNDVLATGASSTAGAMNSIFSGDAMGMLSNMGRLAAGSKDCDTPLRACEAACPIDPSAPQSRPGESGPAPQK